MYTIQDIIDLVRRVIRQAAVTILRRYVGPNLIRVRNIMIRVESQLVAPRNVAPRTMLIDHFSGRHWNDVTIEHVAHQGVVRCLDTHLPKRYNRAFVRALRTMIFNPDWIRFPNNDHWKFRVDISRMGVATVVTLETGERLISFLSCDADFRNHCSFMTTDFAAYQEFKATLKFSLFLEPKLITDLDPAWAEPQVHKDLGIKYTPALFVNPHRMFNISEQQRNDFIARTEGYLRRWICQKGLTRLILSVRDRCVGWPEQDPENFLLPNHYDPGLWVTSIKRNQDETGL